MGIMSPRKQKEKLAEVEKGKDEENEQKRFCADCNTTKTPLWRVGPSGPKSLCNACGIRYRKKRFACSAVPFTRSSQRKRTGRFFPCLGGKAMVVSGSTIGGTPTKNRSSNAGGRNKSGKKGWSESLRMRLMIMGNGFMLRTSVVKKQRCQRRRNFFSHEEKQAAFSLMALSCSTPVSAQ
ncbi:hypothetical protein MLD38_017817 [Melastoma candidum]|uniref:Uncharacterized protein n=1 Tax=Melastoma candidum TaxID=119954 RepID=A0ACB9QRT6_9MYRT|nr:hypothetical protein MLD38_017817 [Melastoma candidum]